MATLKAGSRLKSGVCDTQVMVIAAPAGDVALTCGGADMIEAAAKNAYTGEYPLARFLWMYVNAKPGKPLDPLRAEFIKLVFSSTGQAGVVEDGYFPITAEIAKRALDSVGLTVPKLDENLKRTPAGE